MRLSPSILSLPVLPIARSRHRTMPRECPHKPESGYKRLMEASMIKKMKPFRVEEPLVGPPSSCTWESFRDPRLRKCPFDMASIRWSRRLGGGIDGYVWKVYFGQEGPFALKVVSTRHDLNCQQDVHVARPSLADISCETSSGKARSSPQPTTGPFSWSVRM